MTTDYKSIYATEEKGPAKVAEMKKLMISYATGFIERMVIRPEKLPENGPGFTKGFFIKGQLTLLTHEQRVEILALCKNGLSEYDQATIKEILDKG